MVFYDEGSWPVVLLAEKSLCALLRAAVAPLRHPSSPLRVPSKACSPTNVYDRLPQRRGVP